MQCHVPYLISDCATHRYQPSMTAPHASSPLQAKPANLSHAMPSKASSAPCLPSADHTCSRSCVRVDPWQPYCMLPRSSRLCLYSLCCPSRHPCAPPDVNAHLVLRAVCSTDSSACRLRFTAGATLVATTPEQAQGICSRGSSIPPSSQKNPSPSDVFSCLVICLRRQCWSGLVVVLAQRPGPSRALHQSGPTTPCIIRATRSMRVDLESMFSRRCQAFHLPNGIVASL